MPLSNVSFADSISLDLLLIWNLVTPSFRLRALQSGHKQGLMTLGGMLHAFSLTMSLTVFVITSVLLCYQSVFLVPVPLAVAAIITFMVKSASDKEFSESWNLGSKLSHCLVASIFPVSSPRPQQKVCLFVKFVVAMSCYQHDTRAPMMSQTMDSQPGSRHPPKSRCFTTFSTLPTSLWESQSSPH